MYTNNKAIGPVIASGLLLVVAIVSVVTFQTWFNSYSNDIFSDVETQSGDSVSSSNIDTIIDGNLYFKNSGTQNITISSIKVGSVDCNVSQSLAPGVSSIDVSSCVNGTSGSNEVVVITNQKVFSKKLYLTNQVTSSSINSSSGNVSLTFLTNTSYIYNGSSINLSWSSVNATSCSASEDWSGSKSTSGSESVSPTENSTYTLTCDSVSTSLNVSVFEYLDYRYFRLNISSNTGGTYVALAEMMLFDNNDIEYPSSNMTSNSLPSPLVASASSANSGGQAAYIAFDGDLTDPASWHTAATSTGWLQIDLGDGNNILPSTITLIAVGQALGRDPEDFKLLASNTGSFSGEEATLLEVSGETSWTQNVPKNFSLSTSLNEEVSLSFSANNTLIDSQNNSILLNWTSEYADNCSASGDWSGELEPVGSTIVYANETKTYILSCSSGLGSATDSITVNSGYRYFRLNISSNTGGTYVALVEMMLFDNNDVEYPFSDMSSNSVPSPLVASASSENGGSQNAYSAFNGDLTDPPAWHTANGNSQAWLEIDLGADNNLAPETLSLIAVGQGFGRDPEDFKLLASNTGFFSGEEVTLLDVTGESSWTQNVPKNFTLTYP